LNRVALIRDDGTGEVLEAAPIELGGK